MAAASSSTRWMGGASIPPICGNQSLPPAHVLARAPQQGTGAISPSAPQLGCGAAGETQKHRNTDLGSPASNLP
jgi:hypothetical protein